MSRVAERRRRDQFRHVAEPDEEFPQAYLPPRRRRRWRLLAGLVMLGVVVWLLPGIVAHTPLLDWALQAATADLDGRLSVRSASLGWLKPIAADGIVVRDAENNHVLEAERLTSTKPLAEILCSLTAPGQFRIDKPKLNVVLRDDGSNVEDLLAKYLEPSEEPPTRVGITLKIVDGTVAITDQKSGRTWRIENLELTLGIPADDSKPLTLESAADVADPQNPGRLTAKLSVQQHAGTNKSAASSGEATVTTDALPLAMFQPLLGRFVPQTQLAGRLSSNVQAQWGEKAAVRAELTAEKLVLATPALGDDRLQLDRLTADCTISYQGDRLDVAPSTLECDLGKISAQGVLDLSKASAEGLPASALHQMCQLQGSVDLARLAQMLPHTLHIREQTKITSGQVQVALVSRTNPQGSDPQAMIWQGRLEVGNLTAVDRGRQLAWRQPILITFAAHETPQGPVVDDLKCVSDFLQLHLAGTPDNLAASASFNLKQLADQLGQFVDLGALQLAGDGWAHLNWRRAEQQKFKADVELQVRDFRLATAEGQAWEEQNLLLFLAAAGRTDLGSDTQLDTASLSARAGEDQIRVRLTQPVLDFRGGGTWPVDVKMQGRLEHWLPRLQHWLPMDGWNIAGGYELSAQVIGSTDGATVRTAQLTVAGLHIAGHGVNFDEPRAEVVLSGGWNRKQSSWHLEPGRLTSGSLSIDARNVAMNLPDDGHFKLTGNLQYQADLQRISRWFANPADPPTWQMAGKLAGTARLQQTGGITGGQLDADVTELSVTSAFGERFHEPKVHLTALGQYEHRSGLLRFDQLQLTSGTLGTDVKGQVATAGDDTRDKQTTVQLDGQLQYDLQRLATLLRSYLGAGIRIAGKGVSPVSYRGPLNPGDAQGNAAVRWQWADLYGFPIGPGELKAKLADGVLVIEPLDLAVSGGRLHLAPRVRLASQQKELTLPPGPLAQQVQITPQMCAALLKYVAPVLAGVTTAQGAFSIEMDRCRIPLSDPTKSDLSGRLIIHSVEVGPGPLVRELAVLLGRAAPAKLRRESVVPFHVSNGRVHHRDLELVFPDLTIRTSGSVGFDQTLNVTAEMPIPPKWLGNNPLSASLRNQTIRIPIGGTLSKPQLDQRRMAQLSRQFFENAARNVLEDELHKGLERLFGPPPQR